MKSNPNITDAVATFREAARHLWNTAFYPGADWNDCDRFSLVCVDLFDALVAAPFGMSHATLPAIHEPEPSPIQALQVIPSSASGVPIMINRSTPSSGYWDDPVDWVKPSDVRLEFVNFFDFDLLARRNFTFVEVFIRESALHPHLVGRRALVEFAYVIIKPVDVASS